MKKLPYHLTAVDYEVVQLIHTYTFLTCEQIMRLREVRNVPTLQKRLKTLFDAGFLHRRSLPHIGSGNTPYLYYLSTKALHLLTEEEEKSVSRVRQSDIAAMQLPHLSHFLACTDTLISATLVEQIDKRIKLVSFLTDSQLHQRPVAVTYDCYYEGKRRETTVVIPDLWLSFVYTASTGEQKKRNFVVEIDRGSITSPQRLKRKFRAYTEYSVSPFYRELTGAKACTVVYLTTAGERRRLQLLGWLEEELTLQGLTEEAGLFLVGCPETLENGNDIFLSPCFFRPFDEKPYALLWAV